MNRFLNWAIGIVVVAIIFVGGYLVYSVMTPSAHSTAAKAETSAETKTSSTSKSNQSSNKTSGASSNKTDASQASGTASNSSGSSGTNSSSSAAANNTQSNTSDVYHFVGGGPSGPWQPIGTVQTGTHTTNYTEGSVDWNERVKALLYATNINDNDYTIWRLENGGGPDLSRGIISTKENPGKKYVVMLKWVNNQGWEPTSVTVGN